MSSLKNITVYSLLYFCLLTLCTPVKGDDCRQVSFKLAEANKILTNHVISNVTVENHLACRVNCYVNYDCVSYNLGPSQEPGMMMCQLNDADRYQYPQDYQETPGYFYGEWRKNMCRNQPCPVNITCQHGFTSKQYRCVCPLGLTGEHCERASKFLLIEVESRGKDNYNSTHNRAKILVNGTDYNSRRRGHNLAAFRMNGEFISKTGFDTYGDSTAGAKMAAYISNLPNNTIVLIAVEDSGQNYVSDAHEALMSIGAKPPLEPNGRRASWCLIGHKGGYRAWIVQDQKDPHDVIAKVHAKIYIE